MKVPLLVEVMPKWDVVVEVYPEDNTFKVFEPIPYAGRRTPHWKPSRVVVAADELGAYLQVIRHYTRMGLTPRED